MNGDNVLKLLSGTMEDILNIFPNNVKYFTVHNLPLYLLLYDICWFSNIYVLQGSVAT